MHRWLDTETKAILQPAPPDKYAPPDTDTFALVLVERGKDAARMAESFENISGLSKERATTLLTHSCPVPVLCDLSITDAVLGQFELVCSDSISLFVRNEIVLSDGDYLTRLCSQCRWSSEFEWLNFKVTSIPRTDHGRRFVRQFLGAAAGLSYDANPDFLFEDQVMRKKARVMAHWARKIGARVDTPWEYLIG